MFPETPYTSSLDAALTLVPEGFGWLILSHNRKEDYYDEGKRCHGFANVNDNLDKGPFYTEYGATPALALCIAALKARAAIAKGAA